MWYKVSKKKKKKQKTLDRVLLGHLDASLCDVYVTSSNSNSITAIKNLLIQFCGVSII